MWGNKQGWIISACIAVAMGALLYVAATPPGTTPPTGTLTLALKPADLPVNPTTVLTPGTQDEDAGDLYRQAIEDYLNHRDQYEAWQAKPPRPTRPSQRRFNSYCRRRPAQR